MLDQIELLRLFLAASDTLNFRAAAIRLEVSPQVVTRGIQALELQLGEILFHRSTRSVQLSDFGQRFAVDTRHVVMQLDALVNQVDRVDADKLEGTVRIAAPTMHGRRFIMPVINRLSLLHPGLCFDLRLSDGAIDAVQERIDVGLWAGRLQDNRFVVRTVLDVPQYICAAPSLLKRLEPLRSFRDLDRVPTTQLIDRSTGRIWPWTMSGERKFIPARFGFVTDDPQAECDAVLAGIGIGQLSGTVAEEHIRSGALVELLPQIAPRPWPLTVYRVRRKPVPARIRLTFDALVDALKQGGKVKI